MARTFTPITGGGGGGAYVTGDKWGYQTAEKVRQALDVALYLAGHVALGGDERGILTASYTAVNGAMDVSINGDNLGGMTLEAVVYTYTSDAATSVQARVRNTTDASNAAEGTSITTTTRTQEVLTLTIASGIKVYQLQVNGGNTTNPVYCWGYFRLRKIPT